MKRFLIVKSTDPTLLNTFFCLTTTAIKTRHVISHISPSELRVNMFNGSDLYISNDDVKIEARLLQVL